MKGKISGAEALIRCLQEEGVEVVFGYPGGVVLPLYDALLDSSIRHVLVRHEQGAVHAADGYARVTGKVGVCLATSGPGATNLITGLANAYMDSIPVVALTGQVPVKLLGKDAFQEADLTGITIPITKHNYLVKDVADLPRMIKEAFHIASTGRPGPVLVDIPKDVLLSRISFSYPKTIGLIGYRPTYNGHPAQIARAAEAINASRRPALLIGGGVIASGACDLVVELSERADIPVVATMMGLGAIAGDHPNFFGMLGMHGTVAANRAVHNCDLLVALGTRFDDRATGKIEHFAPEAKVIHIDIDPAEISKNVEADIPIVGDAGRVLRDLLPRVKSNRHREWMGQIRHWNEAHPLGYEAPESRPRPQQVVEEVWKRLGPEAIVTTDVGQHQMWTAQYYRFRHPRTLVSSGGLGTMGFGLPSAVGAQFGAPDRTVVVMSGDGSFQMCLQEMATLAENNLPVKIVLFNNGFLGMVRQWQEIFHDNRYSQVQFKKNPDFCLLAKAYGIDSFRVERADQLGPILDQALAIQGPALIDVHVQEEENVFPMVPPGESVEKMILGKTREA